MRPAIVIFGAVGRGLMRLAVDLEPVDVVRFVAAVGKAVEEISDAFTKLQAREDIDAEKEEERRRRWEADHAGAELRELRRRVAVLEEDVAAKEVQS